MHILSLEQGLSCLTSKYGCLPAVEDIPSDQMFICSPAIWLSLTHLYHREGQLHEVHVTCWASLHAMWHIQASSYLAEVDVTLLAGEVIIWQDGTSACVFKNLHKLSVIHPALTEAEVLTMVFTWQRNKTLVMNYIPPNVAKQTIYLIDPLNCSSYEGKKSSSSDFFSWISLSSKRFHFIIALVNR